MNDAVLAGLDYLRRGRQERKVLVVVSDGADNASVTTSQEIVAHIRSSNALIYTVALVDPAVRTRRLVKGELIGSLNVPHLEHSAVVCEGDDSSTLRVGIGHLSDTPLPWQPGNSALAGHRDTFFRMLRDLHVGDHLSLTTLYGDLHYRVREISVVDPTDLWVLNPTDTPTLTLITCSRTSAARRSASSCAPTDCDLGLTTSARRAAV